MRGIVAFALAFALAGPALAQVQLPAFRAGAVMRFSAETRVARSIDPELPAGSGRDWRFDLQVLSANPDGSARVRYVLRDWDSRGPYTKADSLLAGLRDIPVELDVSPAGEPVDIANWAEIKPHFAAAMADNPAAQGADDAAAQTSTMGALFDGALSEMAVMQSRAPIAPGHTVLRADAHTPPNTHRTETLDLLNQDAATCHVEIRHTLDDVTRSFGHPGSERTIDASAVISTADGWVVSLDETETYGHTIMTDAIRRVSYAGCPSG